MLDVRARAPSSARASRRSAPFPTKPIGRCDGRDVDTAHDRALDSVDGDLGPDRIDEAFPGTLGVGSRRIGLGAPAVTDRGSL